MNSGKSFWQSKTFWLNVIGIGAMLVQSSTGFIIDPEYQASILAVINLVLRGITKEPIDWSKSGSVLPIVMLLLLMSSTVSMQGCAITTALIDDHTLIAELAVRAATGRVLEEHPDWTEQTYHITGDAIQLLSDDDTTSLAGLQQFVVEKIPWDKMTPEEQALLTTLITAVRLQVEQSLADRGVIAPGETTIRAAMVLTWINQTAKLRMSKLSETGGPSSVACSLCTSGRLALTIDSHA
jgi:hypothetical protein